MPEKNAECDVCGAEIRPGKERSPGPLNFCEDCETEFAEFKVPRCC